MRSVSNITALLLAVKAHGLFGYSTGIKHRPPSSVMRRLHRLGLVRSERVQRTPRSRVTVWFLTEKGHERVRRATR